MDRRYLKYIPYICITRESCRAVDRPGPSLTKADVLGDDVCRVSAAWFASARLDGVQEHVVRVWLVPPRSAVGLDLLHQEPQHLEQRVGRERPD